MNEELKGIIQKMIDNDESQETINMVIAEYERRNETDDESGKTTPTDQDTSVDVEQVSDMDLPSEDGSLDSPKVEEEKPEEDVEAVGVVDNVVDFFSDIRDAFSQGYMQGERTDEGIELGGFGVVDDPASDEEVTRWIEGQQKQAKLNSQSYEMKEFDRIYEEAGGGAWGFLKGVAYNPSTLSTMLASSMASQYSSIVNSEEVAAAALAGGATGAAAGTAGLGFGIIAGGIAGAMTSSMAMMEAGLTFNELMMKEIGGDINDPGAKEKIRAVLDNPEKLSELKSKARNRGIAIGAVELLTLGVAKGVGGKIASKLSRVAAVGGIEITGGGLGEVAGRQAAGQEFDAKEIGFEAFAGLGSAPLTMSMQATKLNKAIQTAEISKKIRDSNEYGDVVDAYKSDKDGNFKTNAIDVEISKLSKSSQILDDRVEEQVLSGKMTKAEGDVVRQNFRRVQGSVSNIKSLDLTTEQEAEAVDKLAARKKLQIELDDLKKEKSTALTESKNKELEALDAELTDIIRADSTTKVEESSTFAKKAGKAFGIEVVDNLTSAEIAEQFDTKKTKFSEANGFFKDGKIYINKEVAIETRAVSVGSHELLHGILKNSLMTNKESSKIIQDFRNQLNKEQNAAIDLRANQKDKNGKRLYSESDLEAAPDEYLAFFSDAIAKNEIKFDEGLGTMLMDFITPILRKAGFAKIKFNTGKDVYNFMREYNKSIKSGNLTKSIQEDLVSSENQKLFDSEYKRLSLSTKQDIAFEENENIDTGHTTFEGDFKVGDTQFGLKLIPLDNISDDFEAEFELKKQLEAKNINTKELLSVEFEDFEDGLDITGKSLEGKTSAIKTFSVVANSVLDFVKQNNVKGVVFNSSEANRTRLYKTMVDRFSKELGWEYEQIKTTPVQGEVDTFIVTPKDTTKQSKSVAKSTQELLNIETDTANDLAIESKSAPLSSAKEKSLIRQYTSLALKALGYSAKAGSIAPQEAVSFVQGLFPSILKNYDLSKNTKFSTHVTNNITPKRQQFYEEQIGDDAVTTSLDDERVREMASPTQEQTDTSTESKKDIVPTADPLKLFGPNNEIKESFLKNTIDKLKELNIKGLTYNTLRILDAESIAELVFGDKKVAGKILDPAKNLSQGEARRALMFVNKNAASLIKLLPENNTEIKSVTSKSNANTKISIGGLPTGIPRNIQSKFYTKGKRIGNNTQFSKKPGITLDSFKKELGIEGNVKSPDFKVRSNTSQALRGMLELAGRAMTNTAARQYLKSIGYDPIVIEQIAEGKNPTMFSRSTLEKLSGINVFQEAAEKSDADFANFGESSWNPIYKSLGFNPLDPASPADKAKMEMFFAKVLPQYLPLEIIALLGPTMTNGKASYYKANSEKFKEASEKNPEKYPTKTTKETSESKQKFVDEAVAKGEFSKINKAKSFWFENTDSAKEISEQYIGDVEIGSKYKLKEEELNDLKAMFLKQSFTSGTGKNRTIQQKFLDTMWQKQSLDNQNAAKLRGLKVMFNVFQKMIADDARNAQMIIGILSKTSGHQNGFVRVAAPMKFIAKNIDGVEIVEEHTLPASIAAKFLFQQAAAGTVNSNFSGIEKNYMQGVLSSVDDKQLRGVGIDGNKFNYIASTPDGWTINDNVWARYFNSNVANGPGFGIDPNNIELQSGQTVYEVYGVDNTGAFIDDNFNNTLKKTAKANNLILEPSERFSKSTPFGNPEVLSLMETLDNENTAQESKFSRSLNLSKDFNDIIENKTGIASDKAYARVKAEVVGANKGKWKFFIPPSAEDFVGLLYATLGKGTIGDAQMAWYKAHLLNPFASAMNNLANDRATLMQDFRALKKNLKIVPKNLRKKIPGEPFTQEQAVRAYIWDQQGMEIPGMSEQDQKDLVSFVEKDSNLKSFAAELMAINKGDAYAAPDAGWVAGTIDTDLMKGLNTTKRIKYLEVWQQNVDQIFSDENLNKLEAAYGKEYRVAMENILQRMQTGRNRSFGTDTITGRFTDWLTNSVGAIMFFNTRSAVLQTISAINFINFSDNNVLKAGQAFANQPQYWKDFIKLFNSPFLLDRRSGIKLNVNEADIAEMAKGPGNSARNVIAGLLKLGFLPTQIADSFAIASGGASFYRNRIKALQKEGLTEAEAEESAFRDFREIAEESQQSSRPDKISQQQAGPLGRIVLAFANTPAQYARLIKKAASDLKNGRGDAKTNISKIIYYGVAQNVLFSALQQALFAIGFEDEEEEKRDEKYFNIINGMSDSILRGIGVGGAIASVVKNTAIRLAKEADKKSPKYQDAVVKGVLQISPPISSKIGKLQSAGRSFSWNQEEMRTKGWSIDNPAYLASANVISAASNVPLDRAVKKITNLVDSSNDDTEFYKRIALALGWSAWELGIEKNKKTKTKKRGRSRTRTNRTQRTRKKRN